MNCRTKTLNLLKGKGMSGIEAVFFDCDGTLVDSEVICSRAYVAMFHEFGITLDLEEVFKRFKGVKLYGSSTSLTKSTGWIW